MGDAGISPPMPMLMLPSSYPEPDICDAPLA